MHRFSTKHRVGHSAQNMFALVADVERYPEFVPLCEQLRVKTRDGQPDGTETLIAAMTVAYKMFHETFTTRVLLDPGAHRILVEYIDGPFRHLENRWHFAPVAENCCDIDFRVEYEFASRAMQLLTGSVFDKAFRKFVDAFECRADQIYGTDERSPPAHVTAS